MSRDPRIPWHELLGKALTDALIGLPYSVSTEEELALRSQRLDVLIIEQASAAGSDGSDPRRRVAGRHPATRRGVAGRHLERTNAPHQARNVRPAPDHHHPDDLQRPEGLNAQAPPQQP